MADLPQNFLFAQGERAMRAYAAFERLMVLVEKLGLLSKDGFGVTGLGEKGVTLDVMYGSVVAIEPPSVLFRMHIYWKLPISWARRRRCPGDRCWGPVRPPASRRVLLSVSRIHVDPALRRRQASGRSPRSHFVSLPGRRLAAHRGGGGFRGTHRVRGGGSSPDRPAPQLATSFPPRRPGGFSPCDQRCGCFLHTSAHLIARHSPS